MAHGYAPVGKETKNELNALRDESAAIYGTYNNARIAAQRGVFMIFGHDRISMEDAYVRGRYPKECLSKLVFESGDIPYLLDAVVSMGFTDSATYPDLHGLALELKRHFNFQLS